MRARPARGDEGSVLLLTLGYALLAIAVIFVGVCATDLYLAQKRLDALADAAALAGSDGFTVVMVDEGPRAELTDIAVEEQARLLLSASAGGARIVSATAPDGLSARVELSTVWSPPLVSMLVPELVTLRATGTGRTALR